MAFVRWRLDRWSSLERLHALDRAIRDLEGEAIVLGLHGPRPPASLERVRDVLLARGTWAPTGLLDGETSLEAKPGSVSLVVDGEVETFSPDVPLARIRERVETADAGDRSWHPRGDAPGPWPLAFPHDVAIGGSRLAIADTGHHRVLVARPGGDILHLVGDGVPDHRDGSLEEARFEAPRGVCWRGEELLVADTGNDAIRSVDLVHGEVTTEAHGEAGSLPASLTQGQGDEFVVALAGEGSLARLADGKLAGRTPTEQLGHPVDVAAEDGQLFVADLDGQRILRVGPGDATEEIGEAAGFVEPLGLLAGERVLVADAGRGTVVDLGQAGSEGRAMLPGADGPQAPAALDQEGDGFVVSDGGGHHLWRFGTGDEEAPARVRLTESPLSLAEHIRLDPVEMAPGGRLELSISYMLADEDAGPAEVQHPTARGPLADLSSEEGPVREEGRIRTELVGHVAASGNLRIRWTLTAEEIGHEAAWDLPVVIRPGAEDRLRLALSTSPP